MKWTTNNRACVGTWFALKTLDQTSKSFKTAEKQTIGSFKAWSSLESVTMRSKRARSVAKQLDNIMVDFEWTEYESSSSRPKALEAMKKILEDDGNTIADLADVIDDHYLFPQESENA